MEESQKKVLLIDLENCPNQINQLMTHLEDYAQVVICYAQSGAKVPVDWLLSLTQTVNSERLKLIKMPETGKNAADFGITFWAGVLMAQLPENTHFDVFSNDSDLDYLISLLKSQNRSAERVGTKKETLPSVINDALLTPTIADTITYYAQGYCLHLLNNPNSRPAKRDTLLNSITTKFKNDPIEPLKILEELVKKKIITIKENKVTYNAQQLAKIANSS